MVWDKRKEQMLRFWNLAAEFIEAEDSILSDPDFARAVAARVREAWTKKQHLIDPNE